MFRVFHLNKEGRKTVGLLYFAFFSDLVMSSFQNTCNICSKSFATHIGLKIHSKNCSSHRLADAVQLNTQSIAQKGVVPPSSPTTSQEQGSHNEDVEDLTETFSKLESPSQPQRKISRTGSPESSQGPANIQFPRLSTSPV